MPNLATPSPSGNELYRVSWNIVLTGAFFVTLRVTLCATYLSQSVGSPPSPRYGHCMVTIEDDRVAVLGGCTVCPASEVANGPSGGFVQMDIQAASNLFNLGQQLEVSE